MVGQCHRNYQHEFDLTLGGSGRQEGLPCCGPWGLRRVAKHQEVEITDIAAFPSFHLHRGKTIYCTFSLPIYHLLHMRSSARKKKTIAGKTSPEISEQHESL